MSRTHITLDDNGTGSSDRIGRKLRCLFPTLLLVTLSFAATVPAAFASAGEDLLLPVHYDRETGKLLLEVRRLGEPLIYANTLAAGVGTTGPLLDRGQLGETALVRFERHGPRVLLIRENTAFRAVTDDEDLQRSVRESFPRSALASFQIEEESEGTLVVDATAFFLSDLFDVAGRIHGAGLGSVRLDSDRSYVVGEFTRAFPTNSEVRAALTFAAETPGNQLRHHSPDGRSITVEQHHSFLAPPEKGYRPREFHPRAGVSPHVFFDFAQGLDSDYRRRWIARWRLEPTDPEAYLRGKLVEPVSPIVFYLDPAVPDPYRSAFIEGGLWWNELFEAAGFKNALRIREIPDGADPMDARYNVIHWVHRSRPGPSVGPSHRDPLTGEILTTVVRMDSHRSLVNHDIWMGFRPAFGPEGSALDSEEMAMARRRQHSAHEIGHTLGFAHNFLAASHDRVSVMDYPAPLVRLDEDGFLDVSEAYEPGPGAHDRLAVRYAYTWYPDADSEREGLAAIMREAQRQGLRFITGGHASPAGSHPDATLWVEGDNMIEALERALAVRRVLVDRFGEEALQPGEPYFYLNRRFAHVYLHHRAAMHGAIKFVGGMEFAYALKGEEVEPTRILPAAEQRRALNLVLEALEPDHLAIPDRLARSIAPTPFGWDGDDALIESAAGPAFDPLTAAHSLAQEVVDLLLHPERLARVSSFHARDRRYPSVGEVLSKLNSATWEMDPPPEDVELHLIARRAVLDGLLDLAGNERTTAQVRALAERHLEKLLERLSRAPSEGTAADHETVAAHSRTAERDIERYFKGEDDPSKRPRPDPIPLPWP